MATLQTRFFVPSTTQTGSFSITVRFSDSNNQPVNLVDVPSTAFALEFYYPNGVISVLGPNITPGQGSSEIIVYITELQSHFDRVRLAVIANRITWRQTDYIGSNSSCEYIGPSCPSYSRPVPITIPETTPELPGSVPPPITQPNTPENTPTPELAPEPATTGPIQTQNVVSIAVQGGPKPFVSITPPPGRVLKGIDYPIKFNWSEPVRNFDRSDIILATLDTFKVIYLRKSGNAPTKPGSSSSPDKGTRANATYTPPVTPGWSLELPSGSGTLYAVLVRLPYNEADSIEYSEVMTLDKAQSKEPENIRQIRIIYKVGDENDSGSPIVPNKPSGGFWNGETYEPPEDWNLNLPTSFSNYLYANVAILGTKKPDKGSVGSVTYSITYVQVNSNDGAFKATSSKTSGPNESNDSDPQVFYPANSTTFPILTTLEPSPDNKTFTSILTIPTVTASGTLGITVKKESASSLLTGIRSGGKGPRENTSITFFYDLFAEPAIAVIDGTDKCGQIPVLFTSSNDPLLGTKGGAFYGISDLRFFNHEMNNRTTKYLYGVLQIQNKKNSNTLLNSYRAVLFQLNLNTCTYIIIKEYSSSTATEAWRILATTARSLVIGEESGTKRLYWFEGSHYLYQLGTDEEDISDIGRIFSTEIPIIDIDTNAPLVNNRRVLDKEQHNIKDHGLNWRSGDVDDTRQANDLYGKHGGTASPMVFHDDTLYLSSGFGILRTNANTSDVTNIDNWQWLQYKKQLNQRIPLLLTNDKKGFEVIKELASITNCFIGFDKGKFFYKTRNPYTGFLTDITNSSENNNFSFSYTNDNTNKDFPNKGYLFLQNKTIDPIWLEIVKYTLPDERDNNPPFSVSERGLSGTNSNNIIYRRYSETPCPPTLSDLTAHASNNVLRTAPSGWSLTIPSGANDKLYVSRATIVGDEIISYSAPSEILTTKITYINHLLRLDQNTLEKPINEFNIRSDSTQLYNQIRIIYGENQDLEYYTEDEDSIAINGGNEFEIQLPLDRHQRRWVEHLAEDYLQRFKDMQYLIELELKPTFYMSLGDIVYLDQQERAHLQRACQVYRIRQNPTEQTTSITLRTL